MDEMTNSSVVGRLLEEISWEGNARRYREGGRGRENVLTAEVLMPLAYLPRNRFLGELFRRAHGADAARGVVADEVEKAEFTLLPGDVFVGPEGAVQVQPDGYLSSESALVLVEAKRIRSASFQQKQLAKELLAVVQEAGERTPLLLLILGSPPPVRVKRTGPVELLEAVVGDLEAVAERADWTGPPVADLVERVPEIVAWLTWEEIRNLVTEQRRAGPELPPEMEGTVERLCEAVTSAIDWHS
ncbi:hypothetical protein [Nocardioides taihuensis]|uniref:Uncharacterized protein n=1 Tax=Nocardioides taihuensis TaxID=1835606 RepID=A0ABW0BQK0_9ACTN